MFILKYINKTEYITIKAAAGKSFVMRNLLEKLSIIPKSPITILINNTSAIL